MYIYLIKIKVFFMIRKWQIYRPVYYFLIYTLVVNYMNNFLKNFIYKSIH